MAKPPSVKKIAKADSARTNGAELPTGRQTRIDELIRIIDHCTAAQGVAERLGDKFLVYMLSMSIQAARTTMRQETPVDPALPESN